jgi:5'-3' exonuclease
MGIPSYFSYLCKNHPEILYSYSQFHNSIDFLYLDSNSIIYDVVHSFDFSQLLQNQLLNKKIIQSIIQKIDSYIQLIHPNDLSFIAFDGVAPFAKIHQQRKRRFKSNYQNKMLPKDEKLKWNTTMITPGTNFMNMLSNELQSYYKHNDNILISTSQEIGEGEHKIFERIRTHPHKHKKTLIYGLDADLIMLSLTHLYSFCDSIYLLRESMDWMIQLNNKLNRNELLIVDCHQLSHQLNEEIFHCNYSQQSQNQIVRHHKEYIFLCFFMGNDFLPHFPSLNIRTGGIKKIVNQYQTSIYKDNQYLILEDNQIHWESVYILIHHLSFKEEEFIQNEIKKRDQYQKYLRENDTTSSFENIPIINRKIEKKINPFQPGWKERYYQLLFPQPVSIETICNQYIESLEWTFSYYTKQCIDWRWHYPYDYPPLLSDLQSILSKPHLYLSIKEKNPVHEYVQLCYVLPYETLCYLPNSQLIHKIKKNCKKWYSKNNYFLWAFCKYFWESHPILPSISIHEIEQIVFSS